MACPKVTLYVDYHSQPCRALALFMKVNNLNFEEKVVSLAKGEHKSDWYKKVNPMMLVPVMDDGGFQLTESVAIIRYLASFSTPDHWYPKDRRQRALVDEYLGWQHTGLRKHGVTLFVAQVVMPIRTGSPPNEEKVKEAGDALDKVLNDMENYFLARNKFLAGDDITVADLLGICELMQVISIGYPVERNRPRMKKWVEEVKQRLQPHFDELHKTILELGGKFHRKDF